MLSTPPQSATQATASAAPNLQSSDIELVRQSEAGSDLAATAAKVAIAYCATEENSAAREISEDILRTWLSKGAVEVREALSRQVCRCLFLPRTIGVSMAHDVERVATPILSHSEVLLDEDLCDVIRAKGGAHHAAIAQRPFIGYDPVDALLDTAKQDVIVGLVENGGAKISEPSLHRIIDQHAGHPIIQEALVDRGSLPLSVTERLLTVTPPELRVRLEERTQIGMPTTTPEAPKLITADGDPDSIERLLEQMHKAHRLTPIFLLRALCDGKVGLFEAGLSKLAYVPVDETRARLLGDGGGREELFARAGIPVPLHAAFRDGSNFMFMAERLVQPATAASEAIDHVVESVLRREPEYDHSALSSVLHRLYEKIAAPVADDAAIETAVGRIRACNRVTLPHRG